MHKAVLVPVLLVTLATTTSVGAPAIAQSVTVQRPYVHNLDIPPREQWNSNYGYCGETSLISAGLYFGQYTSQWTARSLASPGVPQTSQESQLLLGVNDVDAAKRMRLDATAFDSNQQTSTTQFLTWVKSMVLQNHPVIIGVLLNMERSHDDPPGDAEYDHIVPVLGVASHVKLSQSDPRYRPSDLLTFSDNSGLRSDSIYSATFGSFPRNRASANGRNAPMYSLRNRPMNYAIAVTGVADPEHVTIPVRLTSSTDGEGAQDEDVLAAPPRPEPITLTATVTIPDPTIAYNVYLYDDFNKVPTRNFNAAAASAIQSWTIPAGNATTWTQAISTMSDQTRVFRAVPITAP